MNTAHLVKKAQQRLFFLRKAETCWTLPSVPELLTNFYRATIESILCLSAAVWYGSCTAQDRKNLARVVKTAQGIVGSPLPDLDSIYAGWIQRKARCVALPPTLPTREMDCLYRFHLENESIFSSNFLARCDHKATAPFGMEALARILGSAEWRGGAVWLGRVLQQLIKDTS
ncbi:hypothetical protein L3Q82_001298 [Scortum barcoo]|uniref:Uncharacterized protein n=1 Tax=Scortum barcoo TaxID=214431 RepID=A0ACB8W8B8_9TELE|nr:hypothetical protein L3Q82_001298 [Scortum barcoo]